MRRISSFTDKYEEVIEKKKSEDYGLNIESLKHWSALKSQEKFFDEDYLQELALSKVRGFVTAITKLVKIQSWLRMQLERCRYGVIRNQRIQIKKSIFLAWKIQSNASRHFFKILSKKVINAWYTEMTDEKRLRRIVSFYFASCLKRSCLSPQAVIAVFNPDYAFLDITVCDKLKVRRLILEKLWISWISHIRAQKAVHYRATLVLSRMMRRSNGPLWIKEAGIVSPNL